MIDVRDYAALSAVVYQDARGEGNVNPLPSSWGRIAYASDMTDSAFASGFSAGAYRNTQTGEIVIAYKGTDFLYGSNNGQSNADWLANFGLGLSIGSSQALAAAQFYAQIKAANPTANITFTGHSLGGGLASIMSVWFNQPATVFAEAPFEATAVNGDYAKFVLDGLKSMGHSESIWGELNNLIHEVATPDVSGPPSYEVDMHEYGIASPMS